MLKVGKNYDGNVMYAQDEDFINYLKGSTEMKSKMTRQQWAHFKKMAKKHYKDKV
jgi:hypothetical protein